MKALLIDHDDSFTQNLKHWLQVLFDEVFVIHHMEVGHPNFKIDPPVSLIVLSPGPKSPRDYPHILEFLKNLNPHVAVYGVCLGLQMMAEASGISTAVYDPPLHGKTSSLQILDSDYQVFQNHQVARYHSIKVNAHCTEKFLVIAESREDQHPMWLSHREKKWLGVQFHPESFLTEQPALHLKALQYWLER